MKYGTYIPWIGLLVLWHSFNGLSHFPNFTMRSESVEFYFLGQQKMRLQSFTPSFPVAHAMDGASAALQSVGESWRPVLFPTVLAHGSLDFTTAEKNMAQVRKVLREFAQRKVQVIVVPVPDALFLPAFQNLSELTTLYGEILQWPETLNLESVYQKEKPEALFDVGDWHWTSFALGLAAREIALRLGALDVVLRTEGRLVTRAGERAIAQKHRFFPLRQREGTLFSFRPIVSEAMYRLTAKKRVGNRVFVCGTSFSNKYRDEGGSLANVLDSVVDGEVVDLAVDAGGLLGSIRRLKTLQPGDTVVWEFPLSLFVQSAKNLSQ